MSLPNASLSGVGMRNSRPTSKLIIEVANGLRRNQWAAVRQASLEYIASDRSHDRITRLRKAFNQAGRPDLLLDLLLSEESEAFGHIALAAAALSIGSELNREAELGRWIASRPPSKMHWTNGDYLRRLLPRRHVFAQILHDLKYPDLPAIRGASDVIAYAEKAADRIIVNPRLLDHLYRHSKFGSLPRDVWTRRVCTAFCIDHIVRDTKLEDGWHAILDSDAASRALEQLGAAKGALVVTTHAGFTKLGIAWFKHSVPNALMVVNGPGEPGARRVSATEDGRGALFQLYRALQDNAVVLMAPDSHIGARTSSIQLLGAEWALAEGAALLAYESRTSLFWCVVLRDGNRFVPLIVPGPQPVRGETYDEFKKRFFRFYAEQLEVLMTGQPDNVVVKKGWADVFAAANP